MSYKGFITTIMAGAIAVTSLSAAPARADSDAAKIITGVAALAIIGAAIADSNRRDRYVTRHNYYYPQPRQRYHRHNGYTHTHVYTHSHSHGTYRHNRYGNRYYGHP